MTNITPLHVAAGRSPDAATKKRRGKSETTYASTASVQRMVKAARMSGLDPQSITYRPDGSVSLSNALPALAEPVDQFGQWEHRL